MLFQRGVGKQMFIWVILRTTEEHKFIKAVYFLLLISPLLGLEALC